MEKVYCTNKIKYVYLDMDGVIADFVGGVARIFGADPELVKSNHSDYDALARSVSDFAGRNISSAEMWSRIGQEGDSFWASLDPLTEALSFAEKDIPRIFDVKKEDVYLCSSPGHLYESASKGKAAWVRRHLGDSWVNRLILTNHKHLLASPPESKLEVCLKDEKGDIFRKRKVFSCALVDDFQKNCDEFELAGGLSFLYPARWNNGYNTYCKSISWCPKEAHREMLKNMKEEVGVFRGS